MRAFTLLYLVAAVGLTCGTLPFTFDFDRYLYSDVGWPVTVDRMLDEGLVPTKDFAYCYGLLTLVADRATFAVFGTTPRVVGWLFVSGALLVAVSGVLLIRVLELGVRARVVAFLFSSH